MLELLLGIIKLMLIIFIKCFEDNVICWHAGDGTATPGSGNNNGIGIEMCVKPRWKL